MFIDQVRALPLFQEFSDAQLAEFVGDAEEVRAAPDEYVFREGDPVKGVFVLLEGKVDISRRVFGRDILMHRSGPGTMVGECAVLTRSEHVVSVRAVEPSRLLRWAPETFDDILKASPCIHIMLDTMSRRLRDIEALARQQEKLTALGRLAAGLAHELNNPAAASVRAARQLLDTLRRLQSLLSTPSLLGLDPERLAHLRQVQAHVLERSTEAQFLDPLDQSDREDTLGSWMEERDVADAWRLAPRLVQGGVDAAQLDDLAEHVGDAALGDAIVWLGGLVEVVELIQIILQSTEQMSELVQSIKHYSFMDQTPLQEIDVHEGIESTLVMLRHKMRDVEVIREYDRDLPRILAYGGELNQVWTNLIDNAIDAVEEEGQIRIRTFQEDGRVVVEITDNGPGIPREVEEHLFEPFFTTKPVGVGTGLGLDIAHRIVVDKHQGEIRVSSQPGQTTFQVRLPITREAAEG